MKNVLYLCHGKNHDKINLNNGNNNITIDVDKNCNPDHIIDLINDSEKINDVIEDNTIDEIYFMWAPYNVYVNNDKLFNICYNKLKLKGFIHINNFGAYIERHIIYKYYGMRIIFMGADGKFDNHRSDNSLYATTVPSHMTLDYKQIFTDFIKNLYFKRYIYLHDCHRKKYYKDKMNNTYMYKDCTINLMLIKDD